MKYLRYMLLLLLPAVVLLPAPYVKAVTASDDLLHGSSLYIAESAQLSTGVYWSTTLNDRVTENYIEYIPNSTVTPIVAYGNYIYGGHSLANLQSVMAGRGNRVIAAINGDYFNMSTVVPLNTVIEDFVLKSSEGGDWSASVGFFEDGRAIIGRLGLAMYLTTKGESYTISRFNKELLAGGQNMQLFSADYASTTRSQMPSYSAVLRVNSGYTGINQVMTAYVESRQALDGPVDIPDGCLLLAIAQDSPNDIAKGILTDLQPGQQVSIDFKGNAAWENARYAVGGGERLLINGQVVAPQFSAGSTATYMPRTAFGLRADGSFIMYSVDGRQQGYSAGASLTEVALRLLELGCVDAINLDGGGSTTLATVYPGLEGLKTVNRPSDGSLRTCANYIMLVNRGYQGGAARNLHLYPFDVLVLAGASLEFSPAATNEDYLPAALPFARINYNLSNEAIGRLDENGRFTAGPNVASGYVYAESGGISGRARITVVDRVDSILMTYKSSGRQVGGELTLHSGGSSELSMQATYNHMNIVADAGSFIWKLTGDIGDIDQNGVLKLHQDISEGSGVLTASLGDKSVSVPVRISNRSELKEDFESFIDIEGQGWSFASNVDKAFVRFGARSASLDYYFETDEDKSLSIPLPIALTDSPSHLNFWLYGDASGNQMAISALQEGEVIALPAANLDFEGWKYISLPLPAGITALNGFELLRAGGDTGKIYIDHIMSAHGLYIDNEPPQISLTVEDGVLTGEVYDAVDKELKAAYIRLNYDGMTLDFTYDPAGQKLTAALPESDGRAHRLTVTARDRSGNIGSASFDIEAGEEQQQPFIDMSGHWAENYTTYLYQQGIVNGIQSERGFAYAPDINMNRAQFAVIMCNWLKVDTGQYTHIELPFDDEDSIGDWAYDCVQAMYALGITKGSAANGKLNYNPASPISRAEAMTMIGRTQERGYAETELTFTDSAAVPQWAAPYVRTLVAQQVVGGIGDNKLAPNAYVTRAQVAKMLYSLI
ncbi:MAG: phosphodiester glycosidase family protein [Clostridiales bacterium]|nr:phosphodiester glycosidase family protein [Clostridiales bacterium]